MKEAAAWAIGYIAQHTAGEGKSIRSNPRVLASFPTLSRVHVCPSRVPLYGRDVEGLAYNRTSFSSFDVALRAPREDLAQNVLDAGTVPLLVLCIQEPEITLKRISASAMSDICKHTPEHAQVVVDAGAVAYLSPLIMHPDSKLKRQVRGGWIKENWRFEEVWRCRHDGG